MTNTPRVPLLLVTLVAAALSAPACADVLVCGRKLLEGEILSENEDAIVIRLTSGEEEKVRRRRVDEIVRGKDIDTYLNDRAEASADDPDVLVQLAALARSSRKPDLATDIYRKVLELDATNMTAGRAMRWPVVDGKFVDPESLPQAPVRAPGGDAAAKAKGPGIAYTVVEKIEGVTWKDWLLRHPNPDYKESIGSQLAGDLFFHGHAWNLYREANAASAEYDAAIVLNAKKGKTTDFFGAHDLQSFYDVEVTLEVTRRSDGVRVLWCKSTADQGNSSEGKAVRNSFLKACLNLKKDEKVAASPLWADPASAPKQGEIIEITEKGKKKKGR